MQSHLSILALISCAIRVLVGKSLPCLHFEVFSRCTFKVSDLTLRSLIAFEKGEKQRSSLTLLHVAIQLSQYHLLKRLSFLQCILLVPFENQMAVAVWVYFWVFSIPVVFVSAFVPGPCYIYYNHSVIQFEVSYCDTSDIACFAQDCFGYLESFMSPCEV
jgi:hypothetical protein